MTELALMEETQSFQSKLAFDVMVVPLSVVGGAVKDVFTAKFSA